MLQFIHKVNEDDDWLLSTSAIVLPCLNRIYCEILAGADPSKKANTGTLNVAISSRVKKDKYALRALCGVFEVCLDFCDVVTDENQNHLGIFLRTSAAVLFGSDFQRERDTTCETEYAMDELARYSSFALSNILLTYPSVVSIAEAILGKRIPALFKSLSSSPELSIQRSLVFILRVLYDSSGKSTSSSRNLKSLIENELMSSRFGNGAALSLFKTFLLDADDAAEQGELVISKMFEKGEVESTCFKSEKCSVQQKDLGANKRRAPFQAVSIDWNRNSIVIHKGTKRQYWPIFSISSFEWRKGRKELYIQHNSFADRGYVDMTIRFAAGSISEENKVIIEERIRKIIAIEANTKESLDETCPLLDRKVSAVVSAPSPRAIEEEESLCTTRSSDENPSQNPSQIQENISSPFEKPERTIFSNIHADGILVLERKRKQDFEGGEDAQIPSRLEENKNDMDVMNSPVLEQEQRKTESSGGQPFPISKRRKKAVSNGRNKKNVDYPQASSSHSLLKCSSEKVKMPTASILPQEGTSNESESDQSWREGDLSGSEKGTADTNKTSSNPSPLASPVVASLREDSAQKPKNTSLGSEYQDASEGNEKSMDMRFGGEEHTRDNPVGGGCESDFSSCAHQESSQSRRGKMRSFLKEDEEMLKKLHYTVREILKVWKN